MITNLDPASILIAADIHSVEGKSRLGEVLSLVKDDGNAVMPRVAVFGGDSAGITGGNITPELRAKYWLPHYRVTDLAGEARDVLGKDLKCLFTYGSHDKNEAGGYDNFFSGPACFDGFYIYGISFAQMSFDDRSQLLAANRPMPVRPAAHDVSGSSEKASASVLMHDNSDKHGSSDAGRRSMPPHIHGDYDGSDLDDPYGCCAAEAVPRFLEWSDSLNDSFPVFVISHVPAHVHRGDNRGAARWADALNRAAEKRSVFLFFAHNHTTERSTGYDRDFYLVRPGSVLQVQGTQIDDHINTKISFTYMNAGYLVNGCCTLITLSDRDGDGAYDEAVCARYAVSENERQFGSTGTDSPYVCRLRT